MLFYQRLAEEAEELGVDLVGDLHEFGRILFELAVVAIDDDELARIVLDPGFVAVVEAGEEVHAHGLLEVAATLVNLVDEVRQAGADVDHEVGEADQGDHGVEEVGVVVKVAVGHHAHGVEVGGEDAGVFEDGTVLHDGVGALGDLDYLLEALGQEVDLDVEGPTGHVGIVICQIGIVVDGLEAWCPTVALGEHLGECGFAATDVAGDGDMHI